MENAILPTRPGRSTCMYFLIVSLVGVAPKALQKPGQLHNLLGNTPAMPLVAPATKHKLCGFFMPGDLPA
ncbi:MAG: hypothetical protein ACRC1I_17600 [Pseudomonas proteolytica]|uniref:hypothetical protein n=1 Tax=Pseudomonas proteolytica TaxID=219574 RepID=UPI003F3054A1